MLVQKISNTKITKKFTKCQSLRLGTDPFVDGCRVTAGKREGLCAEVRLHGLAWKGKGKGWGSDKRREKWRFEVKNNGKWRIEVV